MTISASVLSKYKGKANIFIETGSHIGNTIEVARKLDFKKIYSIELAAHLYKMCVNRFKAYKNIHLIHGASEVELPKLLNVIDEKAIFWLDGHWSKGDTALGDKAVPLYDELEAIANHEIKDHILLIDDVRLIGDKSTDIDEWGTLSLDDVKERIFNINPNYKISFENGYVKDDILVASLDDED